MALNRQLFPTELLSRKEAAAYLDDLGYIVTANTLAAHSLGTAGIVAGMSTLEVAKMLRHRNPSVTARYVHLAEATQNRLQDRAADTLLG